MAQRSKVRTRSRGADAGAADPAPDLGRGSDQPAATTLAPRRSWRASVLPIPAFAALVVAAHVSFGPTVFWDPPWLILLGNTLFVSVVGVVVAWMALRTFTATGRIQLFLLGCGMLTFGVGAAVAAAARSLPGGANLNVTIYNVAALLSGSLHALASFVLLAGSAPEVAVSRRRPWLLVGVVASSLWIALLAAGCWRGAVPPFFVQGVGPTSLRQWVLGGAGALFSFASAVSAGTYLRTRERFLHWYACALAFSAISLGAFFFQHSVGSPVGWIGRSAQYVGGVYFLIALALAARAAQLRGTSLANVLTTSLSGAEEKFRALAENAPDAILRFDPELKHLYVNLAAQRLYGISAADLIGRGMDATGIPEDQARTWTARIRKVFETRESQLGEDYLGAAGAMRFYQSRFVPEYGPDGKVANVLVLSHDLTDRKRDEERVQRQNAVLGGIARIFRETLGAETEEALGETCLAVAQETTQSAVGFLGELNPKTGRLDAVAISEPGWAACRMADPPGRRGDVPTGFALRGIYGRVLRDGKCVVANDPASHPDRVGLPPGHPELTAFLGVPLQRNGATVGMLWLGNRAGGYGDQDVELAELLSTAIVQALERKRSERALRDSEAWFRLLFETTSDGVTVHARDGVIREVNDAYCAMSGYTRAELVGMPIARLEAIETREEVAAHIRKVLDRGHDRFESRHRRKDGNVFDVDITALHVRGGEDRIAIFTRDITDRKRAASFAEALNAIGQLIHSTRDRDEIVRSALTEAVRALGATSAAVSMREAARWVVRYVHGLPASMVGAVMTDEDEPHAVLALQRREPVAVSDAPRDPRVDAARMAAWGIRSVLVIPLFVQGAPLGVCFFNWQDKAVELGPIHLDFAVKLGGAMSLAIENVRLFADLQLADRRKDEFLGMLSHELRNPLAPILNSVFVLESAPPGSDPALRARQVIRRQTEHLTRLVDDLLDVTRISRGKIELHRSRLDLRELVRRACDDHRGLFEQRRMGMAVALGDPAWIDGDGTRVLQIVGNLLQNAARFGRNGGAVSVSLATGDRRATIRVRDDGMGIPPDFLPHVFEPFVQQDQGVARGTGGLGLGLALVKGLVELHGGAVTARSDGVGRGAEFQVTFPVVSPPADAARPPERPAPGGALRVLVVDDNEDEASALSDALGVAGHQVAVAHDGEEALAKVRSFRPEVVLCDIGMPRMSGHEVARSMRRDPALQDVRLIALTGYARAEDVRAAQEAGFDDHVAKPASVPTLEPLMRAHRAARLAPPPAAEAQSPGDASPAPATGEGTAAARADALKVFLSHASHDLRAPLRHIDALCGALLEDCGAALGETGARHVSRIRLARDRAQALVGDLLTLWDVANADLVVETVDLTALAREIAAHLRGRGPERQIELAVEEGVTARGDRRLLRVVLENLLGNAWKYTAKQARAHVAFGRADTPGGPGFFVRDDGPGFDVARAGTLFEPFQRFHSQSEFEGTGLGLHLVRRAVERHGGGAWIESTPGAGTTVRFTVAGPA
jgi:PAS domain S-box-containing protein